MDLLGQAMQYLAGGLSLLPIRADGSKAPAIGSWDQFKTTPATPADLHAWFGNGRVLGVGVIGGAVSGGLVIIDFEFSDVFTTWCMLVNDQAPDLVQSLPHVVTPGKAGAPGHHLYLRAGRVVGTGKLAKMTAEEALAVTGDRGKQTLIELRAEGGYVLAPGCPAACHESGRLYQHVGGPFLEDAPVLTDDQVGLLLGCARALDRSMGQQVAVYVGSERSAQAGDEMRPGSIYNRRATWDEVLGPAGWSFVKVTGAGVAYVRRPGKIKGISGTVGYCRAPDGGDLLCVFSSNASPLDIPPGKDHQCFSKFAAFAFLNHGGDFSKAARDLAGRGYGTDINLSKIESEAQFVAVAIDFKKLDAEEFLGMVVERLRKVAVERKINVTEEELLGAARRARDHCIEDDPKLLSGQVKKQIDASASAPDPPWKLVILESDPPVYLLKTPFWSGRPRLAAANGFIRLESINELKTWGSIFAAAAVQAEVAIPEKLAFWRRHLQQLFDQAEHRGEYLEAKRPMVVREFLWRCLRAARKPSLGPSGSPNWGLGSPKLTDAGRVLVKVPWLLDQAKLDSDGIRRSELLDAMKAVGMKPAQVAGTRWWSIDPEAMEHLGFVILAGTGDAAEL